MVDIQSAAAEIRQGKKKERRTNHSMKIYMVSLLHRATITNHIRSIPVIIIIMMIIITTILLLIPPIH